MQKITRPSGPEPNHVPGVWSLRGKGRCHFFAKGTSIGNSASLWETFERAPRQSLGATEAMVYVPGISLMPLKFP